MGLPHEEREHCAWLSRFIAEVQRAMDSLREQTAVWGNPRTPRQARLIAALQVTLAAAACVFFGIYAFFCFHNKWYIVQYVPPPAPKNPRPTIVWGTKPYFIAGEAIQCLHEGKYLDCDVLPFGSMPPSGADAHIFYGTLMLDLPIPRNSETLWVLLHEESPRNNVFLMHEKGLQLFNFTATFSQYSDVPFPLVNMEDLDYMTEIKYYKNVSFKNALLDRLAPVIYLQSNCDTSTERDLYVMELMKYIDIDSYGLCLNNRELPLSEPFLPDTERQYLRHLWHPMMLELVSHYKFMITIENGVCNDYMTEKLWRALRVGVVPIYMGAPNVREWLPHPKAAILLEDYPTPALMAAHLLELQENDELYEEHLRHKLTLRVDNQKLREESETKHYQLSFREILTRLLCITCVRLHENSSRVNMASKKHYDCPVPISALTLDVNPENHWIVYGRQGADMVNMVYEKIYAARANNVSESFDSFVDISPN